MRSTNFFWRKSENIHCVLNNIPDIFLSNLNTNNQILIILNVLIPDTTFYQITV